MFNQQSQPVREDQSLNGVQAGVDKHNNVVERTYSLEQKMLVQEEQIKVANHRIEDLEHKGE